MIYRVIKKNFYIDVRSMGVSLLPKNSISILHKTVFLSQDLAQFGIMCWNDRISFAFDRCLGSIVDDTVLKSQLQFVMIIGYSRKNIMTSNQYMYDNQFLTNQMKDCGRQTVTISQDVYCCFLLIQHKFIFTILHWCRWKCCNIRTHLFWL